MSEFLLRAINCQWYNKGSCVDNIALSVEYRQPVSGGPIIDAYDDHIEKEDAKSKLRVEKILDAVDKASIEPTVTVKSNAGLGPRVMAQALGLAVEAPPMNNPAITISIGTQSFANFGDTPEEPTTIQEPPRKPTKPPEPPAKPKKPNTNPDDVDETGDW